MEINFLSLKYYYMKMNRFTPYLRSTKCQQIWFKAVANVVQMG